MFESALGLDADLVKGEPINAGRCASGCGRHPRVELVGALVDAHFLLGLLVVVDPW